MKFTNEHSISQRGHFATTQLTCDGLAQRKALSSVPRPFMPDQTSTNRSAQRNSAHQGAHRYDNNFLRTRAHIVTHTRFAYTNRFSCGTVANSMSRPWRLAKLPSDTVDTIRLSCTKSGWCSMIASAMQVMDTDDEVTRIRERKQGLR